LINLQLNLSQKLALYSNGGWPVLLTLFLVIGPLCYVLGGGNEGLRGLQFELKEVVKTEGYIIDRMETNTSYDEQVVYRFEYSFPVGLETLYGYSFSHKFDFNTDDKVPVEFVKNDPTTSRIIGTKRSNKAALVYIGIALFSIAMIAVPLRMLWFSRMWRVLGNGTLTRAAFKKTKKT